MARSPVLEGMQIWHPTTDRWIIIMADGCLIDAQRSPATGKLSFHSSSDFDPRAIEQHLRASGHLKD